MKLLFQQNPLVGFGGDLEKVQENFGPDLGRGRLALGRRRPLGHVHKDRQPIPKKIGLLRVESIEIFSEIDGVLDTGAAVQPSRYRPQHGQEKVVVSRNIPRVQPVPGSATSTVRRMDDGGASSFPKCNAAHIFK
uniref:hypothetical protein n=1 Tax=Brevundimonas sp. LF-1 TaxID=3126100 RepID=UPI00403D6232